MGSWSIIDGLILVRFVHHNAQKKQLIYSGAKLTSISSLGKVTQGRGGTTGLEEKERSRCQYVEKKELLRDSLRKIVRQVGDEICLHRYVV